MSKYRLVEHIQSNMYWTIEKKYLGFLWLNVFDGDHGLHMVNGRFTDYANARENYDFLLRHNGKKYVIITDKTEG